MNTQSGRWGLRAVRRGNGALILVVLLAIAIMLFLYFGSMGGNKSYMQTVASSRKQAKQTVQDIATQQLGILIAQYRVDNGKLPKTPEELDNAAAVRDPWGGTITWTFEEPKGGRGNTKVIYHSNGPDGQAGTEDDVTKTETLPF